MEQNTGLDDGSRCTRWRNQPRVIDLSEWWAEIAYTYGAVPIAIFDDDARLRTPEDERRELAEWIERQPDEG